MIETGMIIAGRYEVEKKIGTGGMSDVYKAKDHTLGRCVAIKVLKPEFCEDMNFVSKFRAEAQAAAGLEHPNIVNIYDVGSQDGFYYIIMEYVQGITLKTYIEKKGRLNYKETLSIAIQVARGIQAAHAKNIIHRDIKPQNIIISTDGKVKVTDFGIARAVSEHTIHSDVMGSVHYASPEQARNGYVSNRSDIYSLGIVMYEMVTGRVPYDGDSTVAVAIKHLQDEMVPPSEYAPDVPVSLEKIILKCTQKSADRRYDSMESLLVDLRKSLLSPNEDFVDLVPYNQGKTRVLTDDEVREIQEKSPAVVKPEEEDEDEDRKSGKYAYIYDDDDDDEDGEDEEEGRFLNSRMEKIVNILRIVVAVIIALIVIYIIGNFLGVIDFDFGKKKNNDPDAQTEQDSGQVQVPDLRGLTIEEANEQYADLGLKFEEDGQEDSDEYEPGQIISQDVEEGEMVASGTVIHVTVAAAAEETEVPSVVGESSDSAMSRLEEAGFEVAREFQYDSSVDVGDVISQTPNAGSMAAKGDVVTIYVSQGTESAKVPDVKGKSQADAQKALGDAGMNIGTVSEEFSDTVEAGLVIDQSVAAGKYADMGTKVDLVISKGPQEKTYYVKSRVSAPTGNITNISADMTLYKAGTSEVIESWTGVTKFPFVVEAHGIKGAASGTLEITWYFTDANGDDASDNQTASINFLEE